MARKKFGLVLQGGGALGAYEAGAVACLYDAGMECTIVAGASSGAMNAVTLAGAQGPPAGALRDLWASLQVRPPVPFLPPILTRNWSAFGVPGMYRPRGDWWDLPTWTSFADTSPFRDMLARTLNWNQIRDPRHMRVIVSASGVADAATAYFSNMDPDTWFGPEHVLASGSLPPGFPATVIDGKAWWDGGLTDNTPLKPVIEALTGSEPATLPIYMIDVHDANASPPARMADVLPRMFEILLHNNLAGDSRTARSYTRFIRVIKAADRELPADAAIRDDPDWKTVLNYAHIQHLYPVEIRKPDGDSASDFSPATIQRRLESGQAQMRAFLDQVRAG